MSVQCFDISVVTTNKKQTEDITDYINDVSNLIPFSINIIYSDKHLKGFSIVDADIPTLDLISNIPSFYESNYNLHTFAASIKKDTNPRILKHSSVQIEDFCNIHQVQFFFSDSTKHAVLNKPNIFRILK